MNFLVCFLLYVFVCCAAQALRGEGDGYAYVAIVALPVWVELRLLENARREHDDRSTASDEPA